MHSRVDIDSAKWLQKTKLSAFTVINSCAQQTGVITNEIQQECKRPAQGGKQQRSIAQPERVERRRHAHDRAGLDQSIHRHVARGAWQVKAGRYGPEPCATSCPESAPPSHRRSTHGMPHWPTPASARPAPAAIIQSVSTRKTDARSSDQRQATGSCRMADH